MGEGFSESASALTTSSADRAAASLGGLLDTFGPNRSLLVVLRVVGAALLVGALLLWWAAHLLIHASLPGAYGSKTPVALVQSALSALGLLCALGGLYIWWKTYVWRSATTRLYERGVVITRWGGTQAAHTPTSTAASTPASAASAATGAIIVVRWEEIASLTQRITRVRLRRRKPWYQPSLWEWHRYELTLTTGETVHLHNAYDRVAELGKAIDMRAVDALLPAALATYEQGAIQTFGRLKISRMGLSDGHEWMPWNEFRHIGIFDGVLTINRQGLRRPWVTTSLATVPNAYLLVALVSKVPRNIR